MKTQLKKIKPSKNSLNLLREFLEETQIQEGNQYQVILDSGKILIISFSAPEEEDISEEEFAKVSQYFAFRDEEDKVSPKYRHLLKKIDI